MLSPRASWKLRHFKQLVYTKSWYNNRRSINHIIAINIRHHFTIPMNCHRNISFKSIFSIRSRFLSNSIHPLLTIYLLSTTAIWPTDLTLSASILVASLSLVFVWSTVAAKPTVITCAGFPKEPNSSFVGSWRKVFIIVIRRKRRCAWTIKALREYSNKLLFLF